MEIERRRDRARPCLGGAFASNMPGVRERREVGWQRSFFKKLPSRAAITQRHLSWTAKNDIRVPFSACLRPRAWMQSLPALDREQEIEHVDGVKATLARMGG